MNLQEFRICHSTLLEHYQFIEMHLEGIYAILRGRVFFSSLEEVEKQSISKIVKMIRQLENSKGISVFSEQDYGRLEALNLSRNFWVHNCYTDLIFDRKIDSPKHQDDIKRLYDDIHTARQMRDFLYNRYIALNESARTCYNRR